VLGKYRKRGKQRAKKYGQNPNSVAGLGKRPTNTFDCGKMTKGN